MTHDPQMVEAVARAMHPRTWKHFLHHAEAALEASHHAELVAALTAIRDGHLIGSPLDKSAWETMARSQRQTARDTLAKIGGEA